MIKEQVKNKENKFNMKKYISLVLLIGIILLMITSCSKQTVNKYVIQNKTVCRINLFSSPGNYQKNFLLMNLGHAFVTIENMDQQSIMIGNYCLAENEEISMSIWPISGHFGVWYNIESKMVNTSKKYNDRISISFELDSNMLNEINEYLKTNPKWHIGYNCSNFVLKIYNIVVKANYSSVIVTPNLLYKLFKNYPYAINKIIKDNDKIGYFVDGVFIKCELNY